MSAPSSDTIRQLAAKAQVLGLPQHPSLSESTRHLLQQADQERRLLSSSRLGKIGVAVVTRSISLTKLKNVNDELLKLVKMKSISKLKEALRFKE